MRHLLLASAVLVSALPLGVDAQTTNAPQLRELKPSPPLTLPAERRKIVCGTIVISPEVKTHYTMRQVTPIPADQSKYTMHPVTPSTCAQGPVLRPPTRPPR